MHTQHCSTCSEKDALIARLRYNESLGMLTPAGLAEAVRTLPHTTTYTIVFADIDRLKTINSATGNHLATNRYLKSGLAVRYGEIAGQLLGDEIVFILDDQARDEETDAAAFIARISRQLASQPLTTGERRALGSAQGCEPHEAVLSATFAALSGVRAAQVHATIERLSCEVLARKAARDSRIKVAA